MTSRAQLQEAVLSKVELESALEKEKRDLTNIKKELKATQDIMQILEQERASSSSNHNVKQSFKIELLEAEKHSLNKLIIDLQVSFSLYLNLRTSISELTCSRNISFLFKTRLKIQN